jgi:4-amino-4-deoxy-L-arabinose transferase-like glycosyltransferase
MSMSKTDKPRPKRCPEIRQAAPLKPETASTTRVKEWRLIGIFCLAAMARIFLFNAAFPFFNNVDEQFHFDTIIKYAHGYVPRPATNYFDHESARLIATYSTPEYFHAAGEFPGGRLPPPVWQSSPAQSGPYIASGTEYWLARRSNESYSPPLYYWLGGLWYNLGKFSGMSGLRLLYWLRFSNLLFYGLLIVFGYLLCRSMFPENRSVYLGVPLVLVFFPQDLYYTLNSDVPSALFFALSLFGLNELLRKKRPMVLYPLVGAAVGATFLIKLTDIFIAVPLALYTWLLFVRASRRGRPGGEAARLALLWIVAAIPSALWVGWNLHAFGEATATGEKVAMLGWTKKPLDMILLHPIFTPDGFSFFTSELLRTFWRGELVWGLKRLSWGVADGFYVFSSIALLLFAVVIGFMERKNKDALFTRVVCLSCYLTGAAVLVYLSIRFDFGNCWYPSRENPYFTSGRLLSGATVPFLCLYVESLAFLLAKISRRLNPLYVLGVTGTLIILIEIVIKAPVFLSPYNFFHMQ